MLPSLIKHGAQRIYTWPSVRNTSLALQYTKSTVESIYSTRHYTTYGRAAASTVLPPIKAASNAVRKDAERGDGAIEHVRIVDAAVELEQSLLGVEHRRGGQTKVKILDGQEVMISNYTLMLHNKVLEALRNGHVDQLLQHFLATSADPVYFLILPRTTAKEILRCLDPSFFLDEFKAMYRDLGEDSEYIEYPRDKFRPLHYIFADYLGLIQIILWRWQECGHRIDLTEYKMFLDVARSTGDAKTAIALYLAMHKKRIKPDLTCYNYYFEARCWNNAYHEVEKYRLRVQPRRLAERQTRGGTRLWFRGHRVGKGGLREEILHAFHFMVKSGVQPDAKTYCHLITAMGREGDMHGVKEVLKKIWDVDVDYIMTSEDTELLFENDLPQSSPLYPNQDVLFTIAHVMGSNNRISYALRVVDVFSRKYGIEISFHTWLQLFQWTDVVVTKQIGRRKQNSPNPDEIPLSGVEQLWNTMTAEPYNIKPTMPMYNRYIKNMSRRQMLREVLDLMRRGRQFHVISQSNLDSMLSEDESEDASTEDDDIASNPTTNSFLSQRKRSLELRKLEEYRDYVMICRWVRLLLNNHSWISSGDRHLLWERLGIPDAIDEFWYYRPSTGFEYWTSDFAVLFDITEKPVTIALCPLHTLLPGVIAVQATQPYVKSLHRDYSLAPERWIRRRGPKIGTQDDTTMVFDVPR